MSAPFADGFDIKLHAAWILDEKNKAKKIRTDAVFRLAFKDSLSGEKVAEVALTPANAKNLSMSLLKSIEKLNKGQLKAPQAKDHQPQGYIG